MEGKFSYWKGHLRCCYVISIRSDNSNLKSKTNWRKKKHDGMLFCKSCNEKDWLSEFWNLQSIEVAIHNYILFPILEVVITSILNPVWMGLNLFNRTLLRFFFLQILTTFDLNSVLFQILAIFAFATTTSVDTFLEVTARGCTDPNSAITERVDIAYPFE